MCPYCKTLSLHIEPLWNTFQYSLFARSCWPLCFHTQHWPPLCCLIPCGSVSLLCVCVPSVVLTFACCAQHTHNESRWMTTCWKTNSQILKTCKDLQRSWEFTICHIEVAFLKACFLLLLKWCNNNNVLFSVHRNIFGIQNSFLQKIKGFTHYLIVR